MKPLLERYRARLPLGPRSPIVSLGEGGTPLIPADRLARAVGKKPGQVFLKFEGANPTGSFKDRGMTLAISKALESKSKGVLCASTGNTAASAAVYSAKAGLRCVVLLPQGAVAKGKLAQAIMHGADIISVKGNFDVALSEALRLAEEQGFTVVNSANPFRIEGQKTGAFEISEELGRAPDWQFMPVGNAGNITAYWKGYKEMGGRKPRMMGFQAAGAAPLVLGHPVRKPRTVATAIRIGDPYSKAGALAARDESGGLIAAVTDAEILAAYKFLAREEGVFCEPASAAGVAGLLKLGRSGRRLPGSAVCILTGHGLKDPETPTRFQARSREHRPGDRLRL
jgi:threonine synthase